MLNVAAGFFIALCLLTGCGTSLVSRPACVPSVVYQGDPYYLQLPRAEQQFKGVVTVRQLGEPTPNKIMGRYYSLVTSAATYPLPTSDGPQILAAYAGHQVSLHGKIQALVWPDDQMSHDELWISDICTTD